MNQANRHGIRRSGLDRAFQAEEQRKSALLLSARLAREQGDADRAADLFAEVAAIEEQLAARCETAGLTEKANVHWFSAASGYAQAGDFHRAARLCETLAVREESPEPLRQRARAFAGTIRERYSRLYAEISNEPMLTDNH
jgi:hypothetical protein